ncbi:hypothetical protein [Candidiatus Paracoxiella cheracis]|uniref:hypothetical protein n=1 Tax=Candidiatus Paracoxiella cheracis TaxID=3405120 RepID=UPI003BF580CB
MKIKNKITKTLILSVGLSGLLATSPIYAGYYHHHYHPHYHPHHHYHGSGDLAAGLFFGAAAGIIAGAAMTQHQGYYPSCQRVYYNRYCRDSYWGERCYTVRRVEYVC